MNVIVIIADTLRRDHLGCYGNSRIRTPHLDRLAKESIVFDRCHAASFPTMPCRADLLTGKYDFVSLGWAPLPFDEVTLPKLLSGAGYATCGIVDTPFYSRNGMGYDRGFRDFVFVRGQHPEAEREGVVRNRRFEEDCFAATTLATAERWLEQNYKDRFFLLVDTWDPHEPWDPPEYYVDLYGKEYSGRPCPGPSYWSYREAGLSEQDLNTARAHYCGEVTLVDRWVGRFIERVESLGLMDNTAILFTSDHGFCFGEHDLFGKGRFKPASGAYGLFGRSRDDPNPGGNGWWCWSPLWEEISRIPLLLHLPGAGATRINALVSMPDLMPTILRLAGLEPPAGTMGSSLLPVVEGKVDRLHDIVVSSWPFLGPGQRVRVVDDSEREVREQLPSTISDGEWTLVYARHGAAIELYNVTADPRQEKNVFEENKSVARELHERFVRLLENANVEERLLAPRRQL